MISLIAQSIFADTPHTRHNVYFESIGDIKAKYCVIEVPNDMKNFASRSPEIQAMFKYSTTVMFEVKGDAGQPLIVARGKEKETVNTQYRATVDTNLIGKLVVDTRWRDGVTTHVCRL